ncbi:MAG: PEP-CTERM sorting domain-containing protein [Thermoguttaceae bacterium]|nr:PEP-CTERM sorting domain-containing protein [Thermoguttaceae bacterium]
MTQKFYRSILAFSLLLCAPLLRADQVAYWSFDDPAGTLVTQDSISGLNATAYKSNSPITDTNLVTYGTEGVFGGTAVTLSDGGYIQLSDTASQILGALNNMYEGDYSVNLWVKPTSYSSGGNWTPVFGDWTQQWSYQFYLTGSGVATSYTSAKLPTGTIDDGGCNRTTASGGTVPLNEWSMLTFTRDYDAGTFSVAVNGKYVGTATSAVMAGQPYKAYTAIQFGAKGDGLNNTFKGSMDEARIFDTVLAGNQLKALYETNTIIEPAIYLNTLFGRTVAQAYAMNDNKGVNVKDVLGSSPAVEKAVNFTKPSEGDFLVPLTTSTDSLVLNLTGQSQLHGNITGAWGGILSNRCGNDDTPLTLADGTEVIGGIGMHANSLVTFSLDEIRSAFDDKEFRFNSTISLPNCTAGPSGAVYGIQIVSDEEGIIAAYLQGEELGFSQNANGEWVLDLPATMPAYATRNNPVDVEFTIPCDAKYLTLMMFTGESSSCDHGAYMNARLTPIPEPATWLLLLGGLFGLGFTARIKKRS